MVGYYKKYTFTHSCTVYVGLVLPHRIKAHSYDLPYSALEQFSLPLENEELLHEPRLCCDYAYQLVFTSTVDFVEALCAVLNQPDSPEDVQPEKIIDNSYYNMDRVRLGWSNENSQGREG